MSVVNRVWDTTAGPAFVSWRSVTPDPDGDLYPGPGTFGVDTSDYAVVQERIEQDYVRPVNPPLSPPLGAVQGLWLFDGNLNDESPNAITLSVQGGLTERYAAAPVPMTEGFHKQAAGYLEDTSVDSAMQIGGEMTGELMFKPANFVGIGATGNSTYLMLPTQTAALATSNIPWGFSLSNLAASLNEFEYLHEYSTGDPNIERELSGITIVPGRWHHLAFTRDASGTLIRMYVNGLLVRRVTVSNAPAPGANARLRIGDESGGNFRADGTWAWARITDRAFRAEHVMASARATLPPEMRP